MVKVKLFAIFRELAAKETEVDARSIDELFKKLLEMYPKLKDALFDGEKLRSYVQIMVNGRNIRQENVELKADDVVAIFPPVSGG